MYPEFPKIKIPHKTRGCSDSCSEPKVDYHEILEDFGRLLPLYRFVESEDSAPFPSFQGKDLFDFKEGHTRKSARTSLELPERTVDIDLLHNRIEDALYEILKKSGLAVRTELGSGNGGRIDAVVRNSDGEYWFYEIKVGSSARACIRQALAQLLDYAYWPGGQIPVKLVIVGEPIADAETEEYLGYLSSHFSLPIYYQSIDRRRKKLSPHFPIME